jgi:hypothetical protein
MWIYQCLAVARSKPKVQLRAIGNRIRAFKEQRAKATAMFRATRDKQVVEFERRNIAPKGELNGYEVDTGRPGLRSSSVSTPAWMS